jgi:hypothetical protein
MIIIQFLGHENFFVCRNCVCYPLSVNGHKNCAIGHEKLSLHCVHTALKLATPPRKRHYVDFTWLLEE